MHLRASKRRGPTGKATASFEVGKVSICFLCIHLSHSAPHNAHSTHTHTHTQTHTHKGLSHTYLLLKYAGPKGKIKGICELGLKKIAS